MVSAELIVESPLSCCSAVVFLLYQPIRPLYWALYVLAALFGLHATGIRLAELQTIFVAPR